MKREPNLQALLKEWQKRMRLQDWDISITYVTPGQLRADATGDSRYFMEGREGVIRIQHPNYDDPYYAEPWPPSPIDVEKTIVHELLHLFFRRIGPPAQDGTPEATAEHQAIFALADALVKAKRGV